MKKVIGLLMLVGGVCCGLYVGVWWAFIGGICDVIEAIRADDLEAMAVAIGVVKVLFAGVAGWGSGFFLAMPGYLLFSSD